MRVYSIKNCNFNQRDAFFMILLFEIEQMFNGGLNK